MDWLGNDMKLSYIMTDITNIFPLLLSMNRPDRLLLPPININKGSISVDLLEQPGPCVWSEPSGKMSPILLYSNDLLAGWPSTSASET